MTEDAIYEHVQACVRYMILVWVLLTPQTNSVIGLDWIGNHFTWLANMTQENCYSKFQILHCVMQFLHHRK